MYALKTSRWQHRRSFTKDCNEFVINDNNLSSAEKIAMLHYPKILLPTSNDIGNWLPLWGSISKNCSIYYSRFSLKCIATSHGKGSMAEELIRRFPTGSNGYTKAVNQIQIWFSTG